MILCFTKSLTLWAIEKQLFQLYSSHAYFTKQHKYFRDLEITTSLTEKAPEPILGVAVRQGGQIVTGELNVTPGTPLAMEVYLDKGSAPVYGLAVTYMQVTDTKSQEETIIFNGLV